MVHQTKNDRLTKYESNNILENVAHGSCEAISSELKSTFASLLQYHRMSFYRVDSKSKIAANQYVYAHTTCTCTHESLMPRFFCGNKIWYLHYFPNQTGMRYSYVWVNCICIFKDFKLTHAAAGISFISINGNKFKKNAMQKSMNK